MEYLYKREKKNPDRVVRCYLTLHCNGGCTFCSADVQSAKEFMKRRELDPVVWANCINAKKRHTILAGGEPFLYPGFLELVRELNNDFKVEIYSNLKIPAQTLHEFDKNISRKFDFLVSLHPSVREFMPWVNRARFLLATGHNVRAHVVRVGNWQERVALIQKEGIKVTACNDQRKGAKCNHENNIEHPVVECKTGCFLFGPDGYRYPCLRKMGKGENRLEHISDDDGGNFNTIFCNDFGNCTGCDNNIEGHVVDL